MHGGPGLPKLQKQSKMLISSRLSCVWSKWISTREWSSYCFCVNVLPILVHCKAEDARAYWVYALSCLTQLRDLMNFWNALWDCLTRATQLRCDKVLTYTGINVIEEYKYSVTGAAIGVILKLLMLSNHKTIYLYEARKQQHIMTDIIIFLNGPMQGAE